MANLIGLTLGFTIAGEAVFIYVSWHPTEAPAPIVAQPAPIPAPPPARPAPRIAAIQPSTPDPSPVEMPRIAPSPPSSAGALPNVIYPDTLNPAPHKPGTAVAGTGFFVASDGSLLTAAHVVNGCRRTRIASQSVKPVEVELIATDLREDIALLRARNVTPPATLPIGRPVGAGGRLFVLGYPASGGALIPTETWAVLENAQFRPAPPEIIDPRRWIWAEAPAVAHGFSGGPMVDPRNGAVVGIVRGLVDSTRLHSERPLIPASGMVIGPGSTSLAALLSQQGTDDDAIAASGDDALEAARRATVHVLCLY